MLTAVVCAGFIGVRVRGGRGSDCGSACGSVSDMVDESSDEVDESNSWLIACSTYVWRRCCCTGVVVVLIVVGGVGVVVVVVGVSSTACASHRDGCSFLNRDSGRGE